MAIPRDDNDPAERARRAYAERFGAHSIKSERVSSEQIRARHLQVKESASAEFGRLLAAELPTVHMSPEALVAEHPFHPQVGLEHATCPTCGCAAPNVVTKPMRAARAWARNWRFDWCFPGPRVAIEIQGQGRHQTYVGYRGDCEKLNSAVLHGWRVLWFVAAERRAMSAWIAQVLTLLGNAAPEGLQLPSLGLNRDVDTGHSLAEQLDIPGQSSQLKLQV